MRERLTLLAFACALVVGALAVLVIRAGARGEFAEAFSSYKSEPDGARALFLLAQKSGLDVARRSVDLEAIEGEPELVMLGIDGDEPEKDDEPDAGAHEHDRWARGRLGKFETDALLKAVDRGANVVYGVTRDHPFLSDLGVTFVPATEKVSRVVTPFSPSPLTRGVETLQTRLSGYLTAKDALPVLVDRHQDDAVVALVLRRGRGRVFVTTAPTMASNRELAQDDAARFWLDVLADLRTPSGRIEFDEFHHGFTGERSVMGYAAKYGLQWAIAQGIFALGLWCLALKRFGKRQEIAEDERRASADYLIAMARIYRLGGHRAHTAQALVRGALRACQQLTRSPRASGVAHVANVLTLSGHADLGNELTALVAAASTSPTEPELLELASRAARLRAHASALHVTPSHGEPAA